MASRVKDRREGGSDLRERAFEPLANRAFAAPRASSAAEARERSWSPSGEGRGVQTAAMRERGDAGLRGRSNHPPTANLFDSTMRAPSAPPERSRP